MSKAFLIVLLILVVLFLLLYPFIGALIKDKRELSDKTIEELFPFFFNTISNGLFEGNGELTLFDDNPKIANMMSTDPNQQNMIVHFLYGAGNMMIEVGFKYFQKELRFQHPVSGLRNASAFVQKDEANAFVEIARKKIYEHKINVVHLLHHDEVVDHIRIDHSFDDEDPIDMIEGTFDKLSTEQKKAIIGIGYLIATSDGSPEEVFTHNTAVLQQLRFFNVSYEDCISLLNNNGEDALCNMLCGIDSDSIVMVEPFFSSVSISVLTGEEETCKVQKLYECLSKMGIPREQYDEIKLKNKLLAEMFLKL